MDNGRRVCVLMGIQLRRASQKSKLAERPLIENTTDGDRDRFNDNGGNDMIFDKITHNNLRCNIKYDILGLWMGKARESTSDNIITSIRLFLESVKPYVAKGTRLMLFAKNAERLDIWGKTNINIKPSYRDTLGYVRNVQFGEIGKTGEGKVE